MRVDSLWYLAVVAVAAFVLALALLWVIPVVIIGGIAWAIYEATDPQRRSRPDTRTWREMGGAGFAPRRLHPQIGSCAGEA